MVYGRVLRPLGLKTILSTTSGGELSTLECDVSVVK
jgi:hypothetical protein